MTDVRAVTETTSLGVVMLLFQDMASLRIVETARRQCPGLRVRSRNGRHANPLMDRSVDGLVPDTSHACWPTPMRSTGMKGSLCRASGRLRRRRHRCSRPMGASAVVQPRHKCLFQSARVYETIMRERRRGRVAAN